MGCFASKVSPLLDVVKRSLAIDLSLAEDSRIEDEKIKLLFIGADDSGKKTVFDKMDHGHRFTKSERADIVHKIHSTILRTIKILIYRAQENGLDLKGDCRLVLETDESEAITVPLGTSINTLWADPLIQEAWNQRSELHIDDSVEYWFLNIEKVKRPDYSPDKDDLITATAHFTSGVKVGRRVIENTTFEIYDVVRQRGMRRKWLHCFENVVTAIVYVVDISAYDQVRSKTFAKNVVVSRLLLYCLWVLKFLCFNCLNVNIQMESLEVFEDLCSDELFQECPVILLLNNREAFEQKVKRKHIRDCGFLDFEGKEWDGEEGLRYFTDKFTSKNAFHGSSSRKVYSHVTGPADQHITKALYNICKEVVLRQDIQHRSLSMD